MYVKWFLGAVCKEAEAFRRTLEGHSISPSAARLAVPVGSPPPPRGLSAQEALCCKEKLFSTG